jgi:hypothetical protein
MILTVIGSLSRHCKQLYHQASVRRPLLVGIFGFALSGLLLGVPSWLPVRDLSFAEAQALWDAQAPVGYRIVLLVEYGGDHCMQNIEVRTGQSQRIFTDTCDTVWLTRLTVPRLLDLSRNIEEIPISRCHPSALTCSCRRVFTARQLSYNKDLGYPDRIMTRSEVQPNWTHSDYWKQVLKTRSIPHCSGLNRSLTVEVLSLTELD